MCEAVYPLLLGSLDGLRHLSYSSIQNPHSERWVTCRRLQFLRKPPDNDWHVGERCTTMLGFYGRGRILISRLNGCVRGPGSKNGMFDSRHMEVESPDDYGRW